MGLQVIDVKQRKREHKTKEKTILSNKKHTHTHKNIFKEHHVTTCI